MFRYVAAFMVSLLIVILGTKFLSTEIQQPEPKALNHNIVESTTTQAEDSSFQAPIDSDGANFLEPYDSLLLPAIYNIWKELSNQLYLALNQPITILFTLLFFLPVACLIGSTKIVNQGEEAIIERLGRYQRKLGPGINFIVPWLDRIVLIDSTSERALPIQPVSLLTIDKINVEVDSIIFWKILDLEKTYYGIVDVEEAITDVALVSLRDEIGRISLKIKNTSLDRDKLNEALLDKLREFTEPWGVIITRVEVRNIELPQEILQAMQNLQVAEFGRQAEILAALGKQKATIAEAQAAVEAIKLISQASSEENISGKTILHYLLAQRYIATNYELSKSPNSKIVFMHPNAITEGLADLINLPADRLDGDNAGDDSR